MKGVWKLNAGRSSERIRIKLAGAGHETSVCGSRVGVSGWGLCDPQSEMSGQGDGFSTSTDIFKTSNFRSAATLMSDQEIVDRVELRVDDENSEHSGV